MEKYRILIIDITLILILILILTITISVIIIIIIIIKNYQPTHSLTYPIINAIYFEMRYDET